MNPNTGEIHYGTAEVVINRFERQSGTFFVPIPQEEASAVQGMSLRDRKKWAKENRASLDELVESGAQLNSTQMKALAKRERKQAKRLAERDR